MDLGCGGELGFYTGSFSFTNLVLANAVNYNFHLGLVLNSINHV